MRLPVVDEEFDHANVKLAGQIVEQWWAGTPWNRSRVAVSDRLRSLAVPGCSDDVAV